MSTEQRYDDWAWRQVEALADDSLEGVPLLRMQDALRRDPELRRAVKHARLIRRALGRGSKPPVPRGLLRRLWSIPAARPAESKRQRAAALKAPRIKRGGWQAAAALAMSLALVVALVLLRPAPSEPNQEEAAVRDFVIAMSYLQQGVAVANDQVKGQVGSGLIDALAVSRNTLLADDTNTRNGG